MKKLKDQTGRSVLEMVGVLTIMAVLTIGGILGYSKAMPRHRMAKLADQTALIITNIRAAYSIKNNYGGLTTLAAIKMGAITKDMLQGTTDQAFNVFGGHIFLAPAADNKSVFITLAGLPANACVYLASSDWGGQMGSGLVSVATTNQEEEAPVSAQLTTNIGTAASRTIPLPPAVAASGCSGTGATNAVIIEYQ